MNLSLEERRFVDVLVTMTLNVQARRSAALADSRAASLNNLPTGSPAGAEDAPVGQGGEWLVGRVASSLKTTVRRKSAHGASSNHFQASTIGHETTTQ